MICLPCRAAGYYNQLANTVGITEDAREIHQNSAREMHSKCDYPTNCPCHHVVGIVTSQEGRT